MQVFVTGATGYIGSAVVRALVTAEHEVTGLVRSRRRASELEKLGGTPIFGDLHELPSWQPAAEAADALVHLGFDYSTDSVATDLRVLKALVVAAHSGGQRALIYTSGVLVLGNTGDTPADEDSSTDGAVPMVAWRPAHEQLALHASNSDVAAAVIRPGFVVGGAKGLLAGYFESAVSEGAARFIGDGANRMSVVHVDDLAQLYRAVIERKARGVFHGVDGSSVRIRDLAEAASRAARGGTAVSVPVEKAREKMGPFADALCADQVVVTKRASEVGWKPTRPHVLEAIDALFAEWRQSRRD